MIRKANAGDIGAIAEFLDRHVESSMFLLGNLEAHGMDNVSHPNGTAFFLRETGDGITGVFGCTNGGMLICQLPGLNTTEAQTYAHLLQGYTLRGMTGDAVQAGLILDALRIPPEAWALNRVEPLYRLALPADLPEAETRAATPADQPLLTDWFRAYLLETGTAGPDTADAMAEARAGAAIGSADLRLLIENGAPVAMAGINARAGTAVQLGAVFVPEDLRGQGRGGRATAGLLGDAAGDATVAILFAASPAAASVYERLGFERVGDYRVALLRTPRMLGPLT
ncbi:GNAT family N-acetyltransferase [Thetidibacter halocola]|uniref:GNAT family N-acetyltransferase n=1 Tax=Thetidibacter halocola TaxID=2827239 RepID=A0A8J7WHB8_9RHOB|nr:GNAT family N-acetyltransferase [Thetidibacter halocola]MBS0125128.1 GNAT family N-acetyltransferase [Thetidibacter halocola]